MLKSQHRAQPEGTGESLLPQSLSTPLRIAPSFRQLQFEDEAKAAVVSAAANVCGRPAEKFICAPATTELLSPRKRRHAFELQDHDALESLKLESASLVTVFLAKACGRPDMLVPIVMPHEREDRAGQKN